MPTKAKTATKKVVVPKLTVAEIRAKIGDAKKEILVKIPDGFLSGTTSEIKTRLDSLAKSSGINRAVVGVRNIVIYTNYSAYDYRLHKFINKLHRGTEYKMLCLIAERAYTDAELEEGGKALVKKIEAAASKAANQKVKDEAKLKELAAKLGVTISD